MKPVPCPRRIRCGNQDNDFGRPAGRNPAGPYLSGRRPGIPADDAVRNIYLRAYRKLVKTCKAWYLKPAFNFFEEGYKARYFSVLVKKARRKTTPGRCRKKHGILTLYFKKVDPFGNASFIPPKGGTLSSVCSIIIRLRA